VHQAARSWSLLRSHAGSFRSARLRERASLRGSVAVPSPPDPVARAACATDAACAGGLQLGRSVRMHFAGRLRSHLSGGRRVLHVGVRMSPCDPPRARQSVRSGLSEAVSASPALFRRRLRLPSGGRRHLPERSMRSDRRPGLLSAAPQSAGSRLHRTLSQRSAVAAARTITACNQAKEPEDTDDF